MMVMMKKATDDDGMAMMTRKTCNTGPAPVQNTGPAHAYDVDEPLETIQTGAGPVF